MEYAEPRYTKDLDVLIAHDPTNAKAVLRRFATLVRHSQASPRLISKTMICFTKWGRRRFELMFSCHFQQSSLRRHGQADGDYSLWGSREYLKSGRPDCMQTSFESAFRLGRFGELRS
jgi:hypothetical protein